MQATGHPKNNFDFVRVAAAFCVIVSHQFALSGLREPSILDVHSIGGFGVLVFFSISGYLVSTSWQSDPNGFRFLAKRFLRIWPGFAVAILLVALVLGPWLSDLTWNEYYRHPLIGEYLKNLQFSLRDQLPFTYVGNAIPNAVNGSIWTIPIEVKCYALLGLLGVAGVLKLRWAIALVTLLTLVAYAVFEPRGDRIVTALQWRPEQRFALEFGLFFFAGVLIHRFDLLSTPQRVRWVLAACWIGAISAWLLNRSLLALWLAVPITTLVLATASTPFLRQTGRFGDLSYGLYLYAFPVQQVLIWQLKERLSWWAVLALVCVTTAGLAWASWHLVEKRALRLKPDRGTVLDVASIVAVVVMIGVVIR